jgi:hypothetical protein
VPSREDTALNLGAYKFMLIGFGLIAVGSFVPMGEFSRVVLIAGWGFIIFGSIRRWKYWR